MNADATAAASQQTVVIMRYPVLRDPRIACCNHIYMGRRRWRSVTWWPVVAVGGACSGCSCFACPEHVTITVWIPTILGTGICLTAFRSFSHYAPIRSKPSIDSAQQSNQSRITSKGGPARNGSLWIEGVGVENGSIRPPFCVSSVSFRSKLDRVSLLGSTPDSHRPMDPSSYLTRVV